MKTKNFRGAIFVNIVFFLAISAAVFYATPAQADEATTSTPASTIIVRHENQVVFSGSAPLAATIYHDDVNNIDYTLATGTVFSALAAADNASAAFDITDAQFNSGFNSFYVACLAIASSTSSTAPQNACANWNYVVNNTYPSVGMDKYNLSGGETVYVYFSDSWKISASTSTFPANTTTTLQTWRYQYDNTAEPWAPDGNDLIDISVSNPSSTGWWDATITATTTQSNAGGAVDFKFAATGTYFAKITSLDWSKWSNPITLSVLPALEVAAATTSAEQINAAVAKVLNFLRTKQGADGAIADLGTSDWAAMSFAASNTYAADVKSAGASLGEFLSGAEATTSTDPLNICAGYARHALGLLAAGIDKSDVKIVELKDKIKTRCYAAGIVGKAGINDDIFILLALLAADESVDSEIAQAALTAVKTDQQASGAFTWSGWPGQDVTGAAINALKYAAGRGAAVDASVFDNAKNYLRSTQLPDGGWGFGAADALTTGWAMYGLNALGEGQSQWTNAQGKNPWSVLVGTLGAGGYYETAWSADGIDWFATKHAVPALLGKSWPVVLAPRYVAAPASPAVGGSSPPDASPIDAPVYSVPISSSLPGIVSFSAVTAPNSAAAATIVESDNAAISPPNARIIKSLRQFVASKSKVLQTAAGIKAAPAGAASEQKIASQKIGRLRRPTAIAEEKNPRENPRAKIKVIFYASAIGVVLAGLYLGRGLLGKV
ncbi:hypothetical protein EPN28_02480 [Patescibacteria group bacterium]|nr:MAG: hypothetical protein EPN28_02480 [Patescibacteria group bacterium]